MQQKVFPVIDPVATGANIVRLRTERGLSVRDLQVYFGFEEPQAIYKWQKGKSLPFEEVLRDMEYRDKNDSSRAAAPLRPAEDAVRLDTTQLDFDESCAAVESLIRERFAL